MNRKTQLIQDAEYAMEVLLLRQLRDTNTISQCDYTAIRKLLSHQLHAEIYLE